MARAPHHLYGVADAAEAWSAGRWLRETLARLEGVRARGGRAIVVGGTGLYLRALTQGMAEIPPVPLVAVEAAGAELGRLGEMRFRAALAASDPDAAQRIGPGDRQRLLRAWAVAEATGRPLTAWRAETRAPLAPDDWRAVVIEPPRPELYALCDARVAAMVEAGALDEVRALVARGLSPELPAMKAVGVRPFAAHLAGAISLDAALIQVRRDTRRYAKRQLTWLRNQAPDWPRPDPFSRNSAGLAEDKG